MWLLGSCIILCIGVASKILLDLRLLTGYCPEKESVLTTYPMLPISQFSLAFTWLCIGGLYLLHLWQCRDSPFAAVFHVTGLADKIRTRWHGATANVMMCITGVWIVFGVLHAVSPSIILRSGAWLKATSAIFFIQSWLATLEIPWRLLRVAYVPTKNLFSRGLS